MPPESNVTPLPTRTTGASPLRPAAVLQDDEAGPPRRAPVDGEEAPHPLGLDLLLPEDRDLQPPRFFPLAGFTAGEEPRDDVVRRRVPEVAHERRDRRDRRGLAGPLSASFGEAPVQEPRPAGARRTPSWPGPFSVALVAGEAVVGEGEVCGEGSPGSRPRPSAQEREGKVDEGGGLAVLLERADRRVRRRGLAPSAATSPRPCRRRRRRGGSAGSVRIEGDRPSAPSLRRLARTHPHGPLPELVGSGLEAGGPFFGPGGEGDEAPRRGALFFSAGDQRISSFKLSTPP